MRFLLNMNLPRELGRKLAAAGHTWRHLRDLGMARALDTAVVAEARRQQEVILTHDLDYGHLLAFSGEAGPSVVIFRLRRTHPDELYSRLMAAWPKIESSLAGGAIVVVEDDAVRIRRLPVHEDE